jgi:hypothetical protein
MLFKIVDTKLLVAIAVALTLVAAIACDNEGPPAATPAKPDAAAEAAEKPSFVTEDTGAGPRFFALGLVTGIGLGMVMGNAVGHRRRKDQP